MKILLVITSLGIGGAETQIVRLADEFASMGHVVLIVALSGEPEIKPVDEKVQVVSLRMSKSIHDFFNAYKTLRSIIIRYSPDVLHSHLVHANLFSRLLRLSVSIKRLICTSHSSYEGSRLRSIAYRISDFLADVNTNVSQYAMLASVRNGHTRAKKMLMIPNGIDCEVFQPCAKSRNLLRAELGIEGKTMLLAVGRLIDAKDYPNLLTAFSIFSSKQQQCVLVVAGAGPSLESLKILVCELQLEDRVLFVGARRDVPALMNAADVFVLSSAWEGFGLVVGEAMACEKVVVATDCGGVAEVLGSEGFLVPSRNSLALANALVQAIELPIKQRSAIGKNARKRVLERNSIRHISALWIALYGDNKIIGAS